MVNVTTYESLCFCQMTIYWNTNLSLLLSNHRKPSAIYYFSRLLPEFQIAASRFVHWGNFIEEGHSSGTTAEEDKRVICWGYKSQSRLQKFCKYRLIVTFKSLIMEIPEVGCPRSSFSFEKLFKSSHFVTTILVLILFYAFLDCGDCPPPPL
jgi:hypothetical protein